MEVIVTTYLATVFFFWLHISEDVAQVELVEVDSILINQITKGFIEHKKNNFFFFINNLATILNGYLMDIMGKK